MTVRVEVAEAPQVPSNSTNVKRYVRIVLEEQALARALKDAQARRVEAYRVLRGGMLAEADRVLKEAGAR